MSILSQIENAVVTSLRSRNNSDEFSNKDFQLSQTKPEFNGDYTVVLFSIVKKLSKPPEVIGDELGQDMLNSSPTLFSGYNVIKGFLNLVINEFFLSEFLDQNYNDASYAKKQKNGERVMVEYSSPNTNKPIHLGHLRNNFIGWSVAEILKSNGYEVVKTSVLNDRGIHICKSMIAWQKFGNGATPESTGIKGDHLVGDYYVLFNNKFKKEVEGLVGNGKSKEEAEKEAPIMKATHQMLLDWESGNVQVIDLWRQMNNWVYKGFEITYKRIGSDFDKIYYESETYLLGKEFVQKGLNDNLLYQKTDGSVWIGLSEEGLDDKLLLRNDGTSVYITQDIGLAIQKFEHFKPGKSIYVIGDEQLHHMRVLKAVCKKLGFPFADNIYHLSYGMVELTTGKMKGREGTVVDADDLIDEMVATARKHTDDLGKVKDFTEDELQELYETLGLGAMKYYLLRVDPKKRMVFNPEDSIDFHGFTGPFVQYTYARIQSILRKIKLKCIEANRPLESLRTDAPLLPMERGLIIHLEQYGIALEEAAKELNPSIIANYVFQLAKLFNSFYTEHAIANADTAEKQNLRLKIATMTANVIGSSMKLLGIKVPNRM